MITTHKKNQQTTKQNINSKTHKTMKTHKTIKTGLLSLLIMIVCSGVALAQAQTDNADASASATVLVPVEVVKDTDLQFGNVTPGNTKTIGVESAVLAGTAGGTTEAAAKFTVTKGAGSEVVLGLTLPENLAGSDDNELPINFEESGDNKLGRLTTSDAADGENPQDLTPQAEFVTLTGGAYEKYFNAETFYVWLGGTVVPATDQAAETYSGTITLTATYN